MEDRGFLRETEVRPETHQSRRSRRRSSVRGYVLFQVQPARELLESNGLRIGKMVGLENIVSVIESIEDAEEELSEDYKDRLRTAAEMI